MRYSFSKSSRILKRSDYMTLAKKGSVFPGKSILIQWRSSEKQSRLGITVTKKYGKAHSRNRFKRHVRESFRVRTNLELKVDINIRPRMNRIDIPFKEIQEDLNSFLSHFSKEPSLS